jgi:hypothetical protein
MVDPAFTTVSLADFLIGIAGNVIARHGDPAVNSLAAVIYDRISNGGTSYPVNHDVDRACKTALQQSLRMLAQAMQFRVHRPKTLVEAFDNRHDLDGRWKPMLDWWKTDEATWFQEFVREIQSDDAMKTFRLPVKDASSLNCAVRNQKSDELQQHFHSTLIDWVERRVQIGKRPDCFQEFLADGWPVRHETPSVRITLYQAWCLFLQHQIKHDEPVYRILVIDWLASIDTKLLNVVTRETLVSAVQEPLGEQRDLLIELNNGVAALLEEFDDVRVRHGELLAVVIEFRSEVGEGLCKVHLLLVDQNQKLSDIAANSAKSLLLQETSLEDTAAIRGQLERIEDKLIQRPNNALETTKSVIAINAFPRNLPPIERGNFIDCDDAFEGYEQLLNPDNRKRVLLLEAEGEHGKSELISRFYSHATKNLPDHSAVFVRLTRPAESALYYLNQINEFLGKPIERKGNLSVRSGKLFEARAGLPTLLFVDVYENAQDEHRLWITGILDKILLYPMLRIVIAGRRVPIHRSQAWTDCAVYVHCDPFCKPEAFVKHGIACGTRMPEDDIRKCCELMKNQRDHRKQQGLSTDALSPLTLLTEIRLRSEGGTTI